MLLIIIKIYNTTKTPWDLPVRNLRSSARVHYSKLHCRTSKSTIVQTSWSIQEAWWNISHPRCLKMNLIFKDYINLKISKWLYRLELKFCSIMVFKSITSHRQASKLILILLKISIFDMQLNLFLISPNYYNKIKIESRNKFWLVTLTFNDR